MNEEDNYMDRIIALKEKWAKQGVKLVGLSMGIVDYMKLIEEANSNNPESRKFRLAKIAGLTVYINAEATGISPLVDPMNIGNLKP